MARKDPEITRTISFDSHEVRIEVSDTESGFFWRVVDVTNGNATPWVGYSSYLYVRGYVYATSFHVSDAMELRPLTPDEFLRCSATATIG